MKGVANFLSGLINPFLKENGYELYDIKFVKEGSMRYLRVYIDTIDGINLDDCEKVSKYISNILDKEDPIKEQYFLEVSSPGVERVFKTELDYKKYTGHMVKISLYAMLNGQKLLTGKLVAKKKESLVLLDDCLKKEIEIPLDLIASTRNIFTV